METIGPCIFFCIVSCLIGILIGAFVKEDEMQKVAVSKGFATFETGSLGSIKFVWLQKKDTF